MTKTLKSIVLATLAATTAISAKADTTNLLQNVSVAFVIYSQGAPVVKGDNTNNIVDKGAFGTKALIAAVSQSGAFLPGDELVRATPVTNEPVEVTNLVPVGTNTLVITNTSTSTLTVSNELILNGGSAIPISNLNVTFGTDSEVIGGVTVTLGTNIATNSITNLIVGTNTTVTATILTNEGGYLVGDQLRLRQQHSDQLHHDDQHLGNGGLGCLQHEKQNVDPAQHERSFQYLHRRCL